MAHDSDTLEKELPSTGQNLVITALNGMGNGAMLAGGATFIGRQGYALLKKTKAPEFGVTGVVLTTVGAAIGTLHGLKEGYDLQKYRIAVAKRIDGLEQERQADKAKIAELCEAVQAQAPAAGR